MQFGEAGTLVEAALDSSDNVGGADNLNNLKMAPAPPKPRTAHVVGLVAVQILAAGYHVLTKTALTSGSDPFVFCTVRDLIALAVLSAYVLFQQNARKTKIDEDSQPKPLTTRLIARFALLGFTGIYLNQLCFLVGLRLTSPAYASAMQPSIPVITFLLAIMLGRETVALSRPDGWAKLGGIAVCACGAVIIACYQGPAVLKQLAVKVAENAVPLGTGSSSLILPIATVPAIAGDESSRMLGVGFLVVNCICMALYLTLQEGALREYPYPAAVTMWSYLWGTLLMVATCVSGSNPASWLLPRQAYVAVLYAGVVASALNYILLAWANQSLGPATVALYLPLQPVAAALLAHVFLGNAIYLGTAAGGALIFAGLFSVMYGRAAAHAISKSSDGPEISLVAGPLPPVSQLVSALK